MEKDRFEWVEVKGGRRPVALIDFKAIKKGTIGGLFKDNSDMEQKGTCWADESCVICGGTTIKGDVQIVEKTVISYSDIDCSGIISNSKLYSVMAASTVEVVSSIVSRSNIYKVKIENSYVKLSKLLHGVIICDSSVFLCRMEGPSVIVANKSVVKYALAHKNITIKNSIVKSRKKKPRENDSIFSEGVYLENVLVERGVSICSNSKLVGTKIFGAHVFIKETKITGNVSIFDNINIEKSVVEPTEKDRVCMGISKRICSEAEIPFKEAHIKKQDDFAVFQIGKSNFVSCFRKNGDDIRFFYNKYSKTNNSKDPLDVKEFFVRDLPFQLREEIAEEKMFSSFFEMILWGTNDEIYDNVSMQTENLLDVFMDEFNDGFGIHPEAIKELIYFSMLECAFKTANFLYLKKTDRESKNAIWKGGKTLTNKCMQELFKEFEINILMKETKIPKTTFITMDALRLIAGDSCDELFKNAAEKKEIILIR